MTETNSYYKPGDSIPDIEITLINGQSVLLSSLASPWLLIIFISITCPYCRAALRYLKNISYEKHGGDVSILVVGRDHPTEELVTFATQKKYPFLFMADPERRLYSTFASRVVPRSYLINRKLYIEMVDRGFDTDDPGSLMQRVQQIAE